MTLCMSYGSGIRAGIAASAGQTGLPVAALAFCIGMVLHPLQAQAADSTTAQNMVVSAASSDDQQAQEQQDYAVKTTRASTKLNLTPRDIPQSVSVVTEQRMKDQNLQSIGDVLENTTGISSQVSMSDRIGYYSRGFYIDTYTFDGIPSTIEEAWNFSDAADDTAIYDRIEVVRGATGLMTGAGNPSASINMVRKQATSKEFVGNLSASYGSWNNQRYVADLSAPLTESGNVRGRVVAGYQDKDSWMDRYHNTKKFLYGVVDADLTDNTTASVGYSYQHGHTTNPSLGGMPTWYSDGSRTHYDRSFNSSADWTYYDFTSRKVYASLTHNFDNGWQFRLNGTHADTTFDSKTYYQYGWPDSDTGAGVTGYGMWYKGERTQEAVDAFASGPFDLFGRQHELMLGASYSRQRNNYDSKSYNASTGESVNSLTVDNYNNWNGSIAEPDWLDDWADYSDDTVRQKAVYTAARFSLADPLSLIVGARYTQWSTIGSTADYSKNNITPYGGLVYDITDSLSAYASYTSIFKPQSSRNVNGKYLNPVEGKSYETGLKSDWLNGRLTASLAVFRIEQDNVAQADGSNYVTGTSEQAYYAAQGVVSKGVEFELNGAVTDNLQMTFGATRYVARDADNTRVNANLPQTSLKLFTRYQLPVLPELTLGGGVKWQNATFEDASSPSGTTRIYQNPYTLVDLFARYQVTRQLSLQGNVNNLFDKTYYSALTNYTIYGAPRNFSVSLNYNF